jgi:hypothetical protein
MIGMEAQLWLRYVLEELPGGVLKDPAVDYLAERVDEMDAAALLEAMGLIRKRLASMETLEGVDAGERIRIGRDYRITLPDRFDTEIRMRPLVKTVFLLFLRHPEGIRFTDLHDYRNELMDIYMGISGRNDREALQQSIDRLTDPRDNSIHEKAANLAAALERYFRPEQLHAYTLSGKAGAPKRIRLDRSLVEWE